ncbi:MAG: hypothetical protein QM535_13360 [Limnohabitans sp.]|nr:hypothetical protein [Limnohabitans sp.]
MEKISDEGLYWGEINSKVDSIVEILSGSSYPDIQAILKHTQERAEKQLHYLALFQQS